MAAQTILFDFTLDKDKTADEEARLQVAKILRNELEQLFPQLELAYSMESPENGYFAVLHENKDTVITCRIFQHGLLTLNVEYFLPDGKEPSISFDVRSQCHLGSFKKLKKQASKHPTAAPPPTSFLPSQFPCLGWLVGERVFHPPGKIDFPRTCTRVLLLHHTYMWGCVHGKWATMWVGWLVVCVSVFLTTRRAQMAGTWSGSVRPSLASSDGWPHPSTFTSFYYLTPLKHTSHT